jgi:hypothetical protein
VKTCYSAVLAFLMAVSLPAPAEAQSPKSAAIAKELVQVLDQKKLDSIATKFPDSTDRFAAALYFPGIQLLVIAGHYSAPVLLDPKLLQKQYRDVYMELTGTVAPDTKVFVQDMGSPGLFPKKQDGMFDTWTKANRPVMFDGDPDAQKISEGEYGKIYSSADEEYAKILGALVAEAKK